jgi:hypothetical protein
VLFQESEEDMLRSKQGKAQTWMANQVVYGVDTSDPDPNNWKPFGQLAEEESAKSERKPARADDKKD